MIWKAIAAIVIAGIAGCSGFIAGEFHKDHSLRPVEVANLCAYYDMDTGKFTWGHRPATIQTTSIQMPTEIVEKISERLPDVNPLPPRKPDHK